jgi:hypothetical protein
MNDAFRAKLAAELGLEPDATDDAIASAAKALRIRSTIAAAVGVSPTVDDETLAGAVRDRRGLVEAAKQSVKEVRLHAADRQAIDSAVAAADHRPTLVGGGATPPPAPAPVVDRFGFPKAQVPDPVVIKKGVDPSQWTQREREDAFQRRLGQKFWPGTKPAPAGDVVYQPSPNDVTEFNESTGQWVEKHPYREIP